MLEKMNAFLQCSIQTRFLAFQAISGIVSYFFYTERSA